MKNDSSKFVEHGTSLLRSLMPDVFKVDYLPDFPRPDGGTARWFQIVFAVGPGDDATVRAQVHSLFERMLPVLSDLSEVRKADFVSLRARRRVPESPLYRPEYPLMFIESSWVGSAIAAMRERRDFSSWAKECAEYHNKFDGNDPLTRYYKLQPAT
jgi:hypothetical protein